MRALKVFSVVFILLVLFGILWFSNGGDGVYGDFRYIQTDDFYSVVVRRKKENERYNAIVVPHGVFSVKKENGWLQVARMNVSISRCVGPDGLQDENTKYRNELQYWAIDLDSSEVVGPMSESDYLIFAKGSHFSPEIKEVPELYGKYLGEETVCNGIQW